MIHVMARVPVPGATKTRLIGALGAEGAAQLSAAMADDVIAVVVATTLPWRIVYSGPGDHPWLVGRPAVPQVDGDLGARLTGALGQGGVAVGTDCVLLDAALLRKAHDAVLRGGDDLIIGRALDGGYTFVAVSARAVEARVFDGVPWSTPGTADAQVRVAVQRGLAVQVWDGTFDIDEPADLERLRLRLGGPDDGIAPHTRKVLAALFASGGLP